MSAALGVDQLCIDAHLVLIALHGTFQYVANAELLADILRVAFLPLNAKAVLRATTKEPPRRERSVVKPRSDVDAVAHEVAVALLDDIAEMNANPELDALLGRHAGVALDHGGLDFDRAAHRVDQDSR